MKIAYGVTTLKRYLKFLVSSTAATEESQRQEFILNVLLLSSIFLAALASLASGIDWLTAATPTQTPLLTLLMLGIFTGLFCLSKHGQARTASYVLLVIYLVPTVIALGRWGIYLPQPLLVLALLIVMAGVLLGTRAAFMVTLVAGGVLVLLGLAQQWAWYRPDLSWTQNIQPTATDAGVFGITLLVITVVSWLSNREIYKSLQQAKKSEAALKRERDNLERRVEERTKELRQAQQEQMVQLYRLAEVGKIASGLFHDLVNPVTSVMLNLSQLNAELSSEEMKKTRVWLNRALAGTKRLESFITGARQQMQHRELKTYFSLSQEITQAIEVLHFKAREFKVQIIFLAPRKDIRTFGNSLKFSQVVANLLTNAIDAYEGTHLTHRRVEIRISQKGTSICIEVQDWGSGIPVHQQALIFEPLFTTKPPGKGSGLGLAICREIVEHDFHGHLTVTSAPEQGTQFTMTIRQKVAPRYDNNRS